MIVYESNSKGHAYLGTTFPAWVLSKQISLDFALVSASSVGYKIKGVVLDPSIIAVMSASLIAPFFVPRINSVMDSVPVMRDHKSLSALIAGVIVFSISHIPKNKFIQAVIIGIAGAFILTAVLPLYTQVTNRSAS